MSELRQAQRRPAAPPLLSIVVPCYQEAAVLPEFHSRLAVAAAAWPVAVEVIAVDDGSTDETARTLDLIRRVDPRWRLITLSRNFGHQPAVSAGLRQARGDAVVVIDADLQDPPETIAALVSAWQGGADVAYAVRRGRKESLLKRTAYAGFYRLLQKIAAIEIPLDAGDFCLLDRKVVRVINRLPERNRFLRGLRCWAGFKHVAVPYERAARAAGESKYTWSRLFRLASDGLFAFSAAPLRLASLLGGCCCALALSLVSALVAWRLLDVSILGMRPGAAAGWTSLAALVLICAGGQFLVLGILGEYVARVFEEVKARPTYVVARRAGFQRSWRRSAETLETTAQEAA